MLAGTVLLGLMRLIVARRRGVISQSAFSAHLTADLVSLATGLFGAIVIHRAIARTMDSLGLGLPLIAEFVIYFVIAVAVTWGAARVYHRYVDSRFRSYMLSSPDSEIEREETLS